MLQMLIQSLDWEDPLEKEIAAHSCSCLGNPMVRGAWPASVQAVTKSRQDLETKQQQQQQIGM